MKYYITFLICIFTTLISFGQAVPSDEENIPYLVTFGAKGDKTWGDDDFCQVFFFSVPKTHKGSVYFRVFDPGTGGKIDEQKGAFNTTTRFSIWGGKGAVTDPDARGTNPVGNYKSGNLLKYKDFTTENDMSWYTFGPFNPTSGEYSEKYGGYIFKVMARGTKGDDGNLYKYFMSQKGTSNLAIEGGNAFTFEFTFRMHDSPKEISHVYPYVDSKVVSVKQGNFDWDNDGELKVITNSRLNIPLKKSGEGNWVVSTHPIYKKEKESTFDIQFHKNKSRPAKNNNVSFYITNQYGKALPFYTVPIGGIPKPRTKIIIKKS